MAGEQCILAIECNGPHAALHDVGIEFNAAVIEETNEPLPMVEAIANGFGNHGLARDACELLFEKAFERKHEWFAACEALRPALVGTLTAELFDRIERGDEFERLARDRCRAALGDIEELPPQVCPTER